MNWRPDPISWELFPRECLLYLLPGLVFHAFAVIISVILRYFARPAGPRVPRMATMLVFHFWFLAAAMIANGIWSSAVWGRLYWTVDYVSDFSPFFPITRGQIDYSWGDDLVGGLDGLTLTQLNLIWLVFAAAVWALAISLTRVMCGGLLTDSNSTGRRLPRHSA